MKSGSLFEELYEAAKSVGMKPFRPEDNKQQYLLILAKAIATLPDAAWNSLSYEAQIWYGSVSKARNSISPVLPSPQGFADDAKETIADHETRNLVNPPSTKEILSRFDKHSVQSAPRIAKAGVLDAMRKLVLLHPDWPARKVFLYLKDNGWPNVNVNTIAVEVGNTKRVIDQARKLGLLKEPEIVQREEGVKDAAAAASTN